MINYIFDSIVDVVEVLNYSMSYCVKIHILHCSVELANVLNYVL